MQNKNQIKKQPKRKGVTEINLKNKELEAMSQRINDIADDTFIRNLAKRFS